MSWRALLDLARSTIPMLEPVTSRSMLAALRFLSASYARRSARFSNESIVGSWVPRADRWSADVGLFEHTDFYGITAASVWCIAALTGGSVASN
jgi:hypothetical protein